MEDVEKIINKYKPRNMPITNKTYISRIKRLLKNDIDLEDPEEVTSFLSHLGFKTIRSYFIAIVVYLKAIGKTTKQYDTLIKVMGALIEEEVSRKK